MNKEYNELCTCWQDIEWPKIEYIGIFTNVCGGKGDVAACGKVIMILLDNIPNLVEVNWVLTRTHIEPLMFVLSSYHNKITLYKNTDRVQLDLLLDGPAVSSWDVEYIQHFFSPQLPKTKWKWRECGYNFFLGNPGSDLLNNEKTYEGFTYTMGLLPYTGVLINASLPSSIDLNIKIPDNYSINFGYCHREESRYRFVDAVCMHEQTKDICIVFNRQGEFVTVNAEEFISKIEYADDIGSITVQDETQNVSTKKKGKRHLLIIMKLQYSHEEMITLMRLSERCLVTGNNSAIECWSVMNKNNSLFMYESINHITKHFLDQQISIADEILGNYLKMSNETDINREIYRDLLQNNNISLSVLNFCNKIKFEYDFTPYVLNSLKRHAYLNNVNI